MKYLKMLGLALIAAMTFSAIIGTAVASAAALYSGATKQGVGTKIESTGTNAVLKAGFATIECGHLEMDGKVENAGGAGVPVEGAYNNLSFTECNATFHVIKKGRFVKHHIAGTDDATLTWISPEFTVKLGGTSCTYGGGSIDIGILTGGSPAKTVTSGSMTRVAGGFLCANPASFTASDTVTTPNPLHATAS
jgi:hypothetical protein